MNIHLRLLMTRDVVTIQCRIVSYDVEHIFVPTDINNMIINLRFFQTRFVYQSIDIFSRYIAP